MKIEIIIFLKISEDDIWEVVGGNVWDRYWVIYAGELEFWIDKFDMMVETCVVCYYSVSLI
jgi:hypothetical protein